MRKVHDIFGSIVCVKPVLRVLLVLLRYFVVSWQYHEVRRIALPDNLITWSINAGPESVSVVSFEAMEL